jgi:hypothetical protein
LEGKDNEAQFLRGRATACCGQGERKVRFSKAGLTGGVAAILMLIGSNPCWRGDCRSRLEPQESRPDALPLSLGAASATYADQTFDAAYLISVLGEVPDRSEALGELTRVLKPGIIRDQTCSCGSAAGDCASNFPSCPCKSTSRARNILSVGRITQGHIRCITDWMSFGPRRPAKRGRRDRDGPCVSSDNDLLNAALDVQTEMRSEPRSNNLTLL